jgi:uncharacterized protein
MSKTVNAPGLSFTAAQRQAEVSPLRSDVAGFIGRMRRGPLGAVSRVEGWRSFLREFGGLDQDAVSTYAVRGYFENGGEVAYIIRVGLSAPPNAEAKVGKATVDWDVRAQTGKPPLKMTPMAFSVPSKELKEVFGSTKYIIEASSPGDWADGTSVTIDYRRDGLAGVPEIDIVTKVPNEPTHYLLGLPLWLPPGRTFTEVTGWHEELPEAQLLPKLVEQRSPLIRLRPVAKEPAHTELGPRTLHWEFTLCFNKLSDDQQKRSQELLKQEYFDAITRFENESEIAIIAVPGLCEDFTVQSDRLEVVTRLLDQADALRDRLVMVDLPPEFDDKNDVSRKLDCVRGDDDSRLRNGALYHPWLSVPDPLGGIRRPLRRLPPSGHVAGVISRLDRERGAHHTPANAPVYEAVDLTKSFTPEEQAALNDNGVNLLRCFPGRGIQVWGGRTLSRDADKRFVAHRRLIHRLVRAIRRVAEPLVFDINGPELRLVFVRAITTILLEAWRAGALKGERPEESFRVQCDEKLNPPEEQDLGRMMCEIEIAPATPMEFIMLRVSLSGDGKLEVFES